MNLKSILFSLVVILNSCTPNYTSRDRITMFVIDLRKSDKTIESIIETHFPQMKKEENLRVTGLIMESIRNQMMGKDYSIYSKEEKPDLFKDVIHDSTGDQFVLVVRNNPITYFLVTESQIKAISTLNKSGKKTYLLISDY